jgi:hypothetical protein
MNTVQPKNTLADHIVINTLKNDLVKYIESIPNYTALKNDVELLKLLCNKIENIPKKNQTNLDKAATIIDIMSTVFSLSDSEKASLNKIITFLINNKHIKPATLIKTAKTAISAWVKKKIL